MKNALCLFLVSLSYIVYGQNLDFEWAKQFSSATGTYAPTSGYSTCSDPAGNVFTLGTFFGSVDFDPGPGVFSLNAGNVSRTFICKLDSSGNFLWAKKMDFMGGRIISDRYGNVFVLGGYDDTVDVDPGNAVYTLSPPYHFSPFACIVKLDNAGNFIWARAFFGLDKGGCFPSTICLDSKQNIYIGGSFYNADFDPGPDTAVLEPNRQWVQNAPVGNPIATFFICSLDSSGNFRFAKKQGNSTVDLGRFQWGGVTCTSQGETISYFTSIKKEPISLVALISGVSHIEKRDINGNILWAKEFKAVPPDTTASVFYPVVTTDRFGNIWVTGRFAGPVDFDPNPASSYILGTPPAVYLYGGYAVLMFIMKLDMNGNLLHVSHMYNPSNAMREPGLIFTDREQSCYIGGSDQSNGFLIKLGEDFQFKWVKQIGENATSELFGTCLDNFGNLYLTGLFSGSGDFNPGPGFNSLSASGTQAAFLVKLSGPLITSIQGRELTEGISFFPNPVTNLLNLNTNTEIKHGRYSVINIDGKIMLENRDISGKDFKIDLSALQPGFYVVEILDEKYKARAKIIKD
jgi:hypothetical protein